MPVDPVVGVFILVKGLFSTPKFVSLKLPATVQQVMDLTPGLSYTTAPSRIVASRTIVSSISYEGRTISNKLGPKVGQPGEQVLQYLVNGAYPPGPRPTFQQTQVNWGDVITWFLYTVPDHQVPREERASASPVAS